MLPARLRDARVLLVDDQELNLRVLKQVLERAGLRNITMTQDPYAVAPLVALHMPDLIVVDLHMPGLDGWGVMQSLKPQLDAAGYLPILVLTADVTDEARRRALESGARDFLTKPIDSIEVILRVHNQLDTRMRYLEVVRRNVDLEQRVRERTAQVEAAQLETREVPAQPRHLPAAFLAVMAVAALAALAALAAGVGWMPRSRFRLSRRRWRDPRTTRPWPPEKGPTHERGPGGPWHDHA